MKKEVSYFENLDTIRFIAAIMVFLQHGIRKPTLNFSFIHNAYILNVLDVICNGEMGVSIFFVLSGFLITYLLIREYELNGKIEIRNFYIRRILRIWPLFYAVVILSFFVFPLIQKSNGIHDIYIVFYQLAFLSNFDEMRVETCGVEYVILAKSITWSVSIEEQFYLFWPLIFTFLPKKWWLGIIILAIAGSIGFRIIHYADRIVLYYHTFSVLLDLSIGGLFACLAKEYRRVHAFFEKTSTKGHLFFFAVSFILLLWAPAADKLKYGDAIFRIFVSCSFAFIICAQALTTSQSILNLKNFTVAQSWGKYTYCIYLVHPLVLIVTAHLAVIAMVPQTGGYIVILGLFSFMMTLTISRLSYKYYESIFLRMKDKFMVSKVKVHPVRA